MKKLKYKYRLYDIRQTKWKYVGKRNIYHDEIGNVYILHENSYIPANQLNDKKGSFFVTNYSKSYAIKKKPIKRK